MKNVFKHIFTFVALAVIASCSPEEFEGANGQIPSLEGIEPVVSVDQTTNQVTFSLPAEVKGCMPIWIFYTDKGTEKEKVQYSTVDGLQRIFAKAGDYECEFKLMNRNGISDGSKPFSFHIDNTIMNFDSYLVQLCGGKDADAKKEWRIDCDQQGHMGCGEPGTDGLNWWSAGPNDKDGCGVYDCRLTFGADYSYTFNPGESGAIYVNKDVTVFPEGPQEADFMTAASEQNTSFEFDVVGEDLYIVFPEHTFFPYIANNDIWENPRYRVESINPSQISLVIDNGGIAWHYILTSGAAAQKFSGFKYDNPGVNLWLPADADFTYTQYNAAGDDWHPVTTPEVTAGGGVYSFTLVEASNNQWQSQFAIVPNVDIPLSSALDYDYSVIITPTNDVKAATVKLTQDGDDGNFLFEERVDLKAYEDNIIYFVGKKGIDAPRVKMVFDFGGNPENTGITIKNITLKDHAIDDGTVLPSDEPVEEDDTEWVDIDSPANLMNSGALALVSCWWADNNWGQIADPEVAIEGNTAKITATAANGGSQWQGQVHLNTGVAIEEGVVYDFKLTLTATQDLGGATVKPHPEGDDGHMFSEARHDLKAYEDIKVKYTGFKADFSTGNLVITLDFPGCQAGTEIQVKDIIIQKSTSLVWVDADSADNLFTAADFTLASCWWADNNWSQQADPEVEIAGRDITITATVPSGGTQWQGQVHVNTNAAIVEGETYDFSLILNAEQDLAGATVKPHPEGDDGHMFSEARHDLKAFEDYQVKYTNFTADFSTGNLVITFDFPGCDGGTKIRVKKAILQKR